MTMTFTVCGRYAGPDGQREVAVARDATGRWLVADHGRDHALLVEILTGHDDRLDQAIAVARDYAAQKQAYHDGRREDDPRPRSNVLDVAPSAA
jgi:hypothetical protein